MDVINLKKIDLPSNDFLGNLVQGLNYLTIFKHFPTFSVCLGSGTCFEFNEQNDLLFLVGTEEGKVHCCSRGYYNSVMDTYNAHSMSVYAVKWNPFYSKYFLTCSADWTVKIWELGLK
jgi:WD40 repeat protein